MFKEELDPFDKVIGQLLSNGYDFWQKDKSYLIASIESKATMLYLHKTHICLLQPFVYQKFETKNSH